MTRVRVPKRAPSGNAQLSLQRTALRRRRFSQKTTGKFKPQNFAETRLSHLVCPFLLCPTTDSNFRPPSLGHIDYWVRILPFLAPSGPTFWVAWGGLKWLKGLKVAWSGVRWLKVGQKWLKVASYSVPEKGPGLWHLTPRAQRLKKINLAWNFQSRLKMFNLDWKCSI